MPGSGTTGVTAGNSVAETAPECYDDFALPEGITVDKRGIDDFKALAKKLNLPQAKAQKLVDFESARLREAVQASQRAWTDTQAKWQAEVKSDPEIGRGKLADSLSVAARAIDQFGGRALRQALDATGAGNNPEVVRAFVRIGRMISEAPVVTGRAASAPRSIAEILYPSMAKDKE
jgi:hypothetical protein